MKQEPPVYEKDYDVKSRFITTCELTIDFLLHDLNAAQLWLYPVHCANGLLTFAHHEHRGDDYALL